MGIFGILMIILVVVVVYVVISDERKIYFDEFFSMGGVICLVWDVYVCCKDEVVGVC